MRKPDPMAWLDQPGLLHMGLTPITDADWIAPFSVAELQQYQHHKAKQLASDAELMLVDARAACGVRELRKALRRNLEQHHCELATESNGVCLTSDVLNDCGPALEHLRQMSFWVPDDLCLLQFDSDLGEYILTAASVICPGLWHPRDKFLRPLSQIHAPVPGLGAKLGASIQRFFHHIRVEKPVVRFNWSLQPGTVLNRQPENEPVVDAETAIYFRSERQTLLRLPETNAVVFIIRTNLCELSQISLQYGATVTLHRLLAAIDTLSELEKGYKGIDRLQAALHKYRS